MTQCPYEDIFWTNSRVETFPQDPYSLGLLPCSRPALSSCAGAISSFSPIVEDIQGCEHSWSQVDTAPRTYIYLSLGTLLLSLPAPIYRTAALLGHRPSMLALVLEHGGSLVPSTLLVRCFVMVISVMLFKLAFYMWLETPVARGISP